MSRQDFSHPLTLTHQKPFPGLCWVPGPEPQQALPRMAGTTPLNVKGVEFQAPLHPALIILTTWPYPAQPPEASSGGSAGWLGARSSVRTQVCSLKAMATWMGNLDDSETTSWKQSPWGLAGLQIDPGRSSPLPSRERTALVQRHPTWLLAMQRCSPASRVGPRTPRPVWGLAKQSHVLLRAEMCPYPQIHMLKP